MIPWQKCYLKKKNYCNLNDKNCYLNVVSTTISLKDTQKTIPLSSSEVQIPRSIYCIFAILSNKFPNTLSFLLDVPSEYILAKIQTVVVSLYITSICCHLSIAVLQFSTARKKCRKTFLFYI